MNTLKLLTRSSWIVGIMLFSQVIFAAPAELPTKTPTETPEKSKNALFDFSGNPVQFEDYITAKQWTVVMFWASDCHVCNVEANQFVKLHTDYQNKNIRVLGVSVDGNVKKADAQEFINIHNINFPNLIGEPETIASLYNQYTNETWLGTPTFMVFSPLGKVMAQRTGMLPPELIIGFIENQTN